VETVEGYASHEKDTLKSIVELRSGAYDKMSPADKIAANGEIGGTLSKLIVLAENYPDLKANRNFLDLSSQLSSVEADIANSRKYYNAVVREFNNRVQMFPNSIISALFGFKESAMFETAEAEKANVKDDFKN